jgi:hypothetical protein
MLMAVGTLGLYEIYWFYKNWQYIKAREGLDISPGWRAFFPVFFCYQCFSKVREYDHPVLSLSQLPAGLLATGWIVLSLLWRLPEHYWWVSQPSCLFVIPVQRRINEINRTVAPGHDRNSCPSWKNWLVVGIFIPLTILGEIGASIPDSSGSLTQ